MRNPAALQAAYYLVTGPASFVSRRGFETVTGPKSEWWLVNTVGALVTVIGVSLATAAAADRVTPEMRLLGVGSAVALASLDVTYVARGRISPAYLGDAAAQLALLTRWASA